MSGYELHFGCRIYHPENAKLTRENYAEINKRTRRNSFFSNRSIFKDMEIDEANECYWDMFKKYKLTDYFKEMENFLSYREKLKDGDYRKVELSLFIEQQISQRIKDEEWHNDLFFLNSLDPIKKEFGKKYKKILESNSIDDSCDDELKIKFQKYQQDLKRINEYGISDMLWLKSPALWKEWICDDSNNQGFEIPDDWFKEYAMRSAPYYTEEKCKSLQERALKNFDANMEYFKLLDSIKFNTEIETFLKEHPKFEFVDDLRKYKTTSGVYILILDEYKQIYIGITRSKNGAKGRIQSHWSNTMPLDRLIWGHESYSLLSIDSFKAYDTTRILFEPHPEFQEIAVDENGNPRKELFLGKMCNVWKIDEYLKTEEYELIQNSFSEEFLCNRCDGGGSSFIEAVISRKERCLPKNDK